MTSQVPPASYRRVVYPCLVEQPHAEIVKSLVDGFDVFSTRYQLLVICTTRGQNTIDCTVCYKGRPIKNITFMNI
jgi:hypothetical protein